MFFSYSTAVREMQRDKVAGINSTIKKMWYGWIVVDGHNFKPVIDKELIEHIHFTVHPRSRGEHLDTLEIVTERHFIL